MNILSVKDLTVSYGRVPALENVSLDVEEGQYLCLVGNNGSGKSTLLKAVMGLVPFDKGSISTPLSPDEISYLPQQNPVEKGFPATVKEVVLTGTQKSGKRLCTFYSKEDKELARRAIETMGIEKIASKRVGCLSGGQQQRVAIARAISTNPTILLADEPTGALDQKTGAQVMDIFNELNAEGRTIIMITHDAKIAKHAKRIVRILDGNLSEGGLEDA